MMKLASLALAIALGLTLVGAQASAQLLNTGTNASIQLNVGSSSGTDDAGTDGTDSASGMQGDTSTDGTGVDASADASSALNFRFGREDMDDKTDYAVTESYQVRSSAGLESYAATTVRDNESVRSIELGEGALRMEYRKDAKFLWVIPASLSTQVTVNADGTVEARYPWYAFLMSTDESEEEFAARIQAEIESVAASDVSADASANDEARRWARIMDRVFEALSLNTASDASVEAEAGA